MYIYINTHTHTLTHTHTHLGTSVLIIWLLPACFCPSCKVYYAQFF